MNEKWDRRFIGLAKCVSEWSKDKSTKVGSVIFDDDNRIISLGYNGLPKGVVDSDERIQNRDVKLRIFNHSELNAILFSQRSLKGTNIAVYPFQPCSNCASAIIQVGIKKCIAPIMSEEIKSRWKDSCELAEQIFSEAGVELKLYEF